MREQKQKLPWMWFTGAADFPIIVSPGLTRNAAFSEALRIACLPTRAGPITSPVMRGFRKTR
jgi:hypothetical protein